MIMRWHYAMVGLCATVILGISFSRYVAQDTHDLGHLSHIDTSAFQDPDQHSTELFNLYVDFDQSMQTEKYMAQRAQMDLDQVLAYFRAMYNKTSFFQVFPQKELKIPRIFHYIWFGKKLPQAYLPYLESWKKYHPEWTFIYWVDNPENYDLGKLIPECDFDQLAQLIADKTLPGNHIVIDVKHASFDNRVYFDQASNYGERSDIMKWEVVYRFGGTYIDVDFECLRPLDILHHMYDFYTGLQPLDTNLVQLGAALFGAIPEHPILKNCVETIKSDRHKIQIVMKTGPLHFTKSFLLEANGNNLINVALPATYFYPCSYEQKGSNRTVWLRPESFAVHHWAGSWLKPEAFEREMPNIIQ